MTVSWSFTVYDPDAASTYDFTDRLQGFDVNQMAHPAELGRGEATFRLSNFDGALTPNGAGSYANVDWGKTVFKLACVPPADNHTVFVGFAADFRIKDDGVSSFVDFLCDDPYAIIGRGLVESGGYSGTAYFGDIPDTAEKIINLGATAKTVNGVKMPTIGQTDAEAEVIDVGLTPATVFYTRYNCDGRVSERIANGLLPATAGVMWPGDYRTASGTVYWGSYCVGEGLSANTTEGATRVEYTLTENPTGAAQELTLDTLQTGHNLGEITNAVAIEIQPLTNITAAEYESRNDTSAEQYGQRSANWTNHFEGRRPSGNDPQPGADPTAIDMTEYADALTNRFSQYRYTAQTATTRQSQNTSSNAQAAFGYLCDIRYGQWAPVTVKYTPTGASSQINDVCVITRRRIKGTPSDVIVQLELLPAVDYQSLVLNSNMLGTLNTNRLG